MGAPNSPVSCHSPRSSISSSSFIREVHLYDWWLIKAEDGAGGKQLGVQGFTCKQRPDDRLFTSAAIAMRHDTVTLVTVDGISILVSGLINRVRTLQNGFSSEVCNQFLIGFPYNWKESAALSFEESTNEDAAFGNPGFSDSKASADRTSSSFSMPIDHLPTTVLRDILISSAGNPEGGMLRKSIFREIVQKYGTNAFNIGEASCLNEKSGNLVTTEDPSLNENPSQKKKAKTNRKQEDSCTPDAKYGKEDFRQATLEDIPEKSVLSRILHKSGDNASILGENSCLNQKSGTHVISRGLSLDETPCQKKKAAASLKNEDDNHVPDAQSRKEVLQKCNDESGAGIDNNSLSSSPFTRSKASVYKKTTVNQKEEEKRDVHKVESGQGDFGILNHATSSSDGPLTRSRAQKQV
ncbi:kinetochore-associated protein KNL-2 homolog [Nicotiana tomentosiformis]|uniref:kinetochore-associated protein KNL-2 homolog n=1 Tax=Nicotiana tomentosiformis TaxID=4098 RepID=UPI00051B4F06|nr:kinetochore-associated protein KNL-2 homolog isoform X1 [Nicotiana tomentosiformis]